MKKKLSFIFLGIGLFFLTLGSVDRPEFGKLPPGALVNEEMGKTSEIVLYLIFDPSLVREKIPGNIRLLNLAEIARNDQKIDKYLQLHPEHKN